MSAIAAPPAPITSSVIANSLPMMRLSVDQYHTILQAGVFRSGDPVELLEGLLVLKMSKNPPHVFANARLNGALLDIVPAGYFVNSQDPITTLESEPEPDASVIRGQRRAFLQHHPMPTDVAMIGEVADSSLDYDRGIKKRIYARASIPICWIVNLADRCIEVFTAPTGPGEFPDYLTRQIFGEDDSVPVILDGVEVGQFVVRDLLP